MKASEERSQEQLFTHASKPFSLPQVEVETLELLALRNFLNQFFGIILIDFVVTVGSSITCKRVKKL